MDLRGARDRLINVDLSLGEFAALVAKALRGAGYPWGLATEGAHAARSLARSGLDAGACVARLLDQTDNHSLVDLMMLEASGTGAGPACPIAFGSALSDLGPQALGRVAAMVGTRPVIEPMLIAPALGSCSINWQHGSASTTDEGIVVSGVLPVRPSPVTIARLEATPTSKPLTATRATVDAVSFETLRHFAGRTYAPATEESRAGAGEDG